MPQPRGKQTTYYESPGNKESKEMTCLTFARFINGCWDPGSVEGNGMMKREKKDDAYFNVTLSIPC